MAKETSAALTALDEYRLLGRSGLKVSPLCLGCMTFGSGWDVGTTIEESRKVFDLYRSKGGNFYDTANVYTEGDSERFLGEFISGIRSEAVVATKYTGNPAFRRAASGKLAPGERPSPNYGGNSKKSMVQNLDDSIKRMGCGYVDLFYVHFWEGSTPVEEVMRGLDDCVRSGKALYVAVSDTPSWVVSRANTIADFRGWSPFIGLQTRYNLLDRSLEGDLAPMADSLGLGIIPWGILAEGFLTGKHKKDQKMDTSGRNESVQRHFSDPKNVKILEEVEAIAKEIGRTPTQVSLNWMMQRPVTSPLVGAKTVTQLEENIQALEFKLTPEQMKRLNDVSTPGLPFPHAFASRAAFFSDAGTKVARKPQYWS